jgi:outer membrane protein OmpA-like peptidoglycan-associated protein
MRPQGLVRPAVLLLTAAGLGGLVALADAQAGDHPQKVWAGFGMVEPEPAAPSEPMVLVSPAVPTARTAPAASVNVSGHWIGTWSLPGVEGTRTGAVLADFAQRGSTGTGKLVLHDTMAAEEIPTSLRRAGGGGVPVVLVVSGTRLRVEHELGSDLVTARFRVRGDQMAGIFDHADGPVRVTLSRVASMGGGTQGAGGQTADQGQTTAAESDPAAQLIAVRTLAERAAKTADEAASLAREASTKAEASAATAGTALAKAEQTGGGPSDQRNGPPQAVASKVVTFAFDKADLNDADQTALAEVATQVREHPDLMVNLEGYTDPVGTRDYNIQLSQRRAAAVQRYLVEKGIELSRIHWVGLGVLSGTGAPEEQAKKRRVTVTVLSTTPSGTQASAETQAPQPAQQ